MKKNKNSLSTPGIRDNHLQLFVFEGLVVTSISPYKILVELYLGLSGLAIINCLPAVIDNELAHSHPLPSLSLV